MELMKLGGLKGWGGKEKPNHFLSGFHGTEQDIATCTVGLSSSLPDRDQCWMLPREGVETANKVTIVFQYSAVNKAENSSLIPVYFPSVLLKFAGSLAFV